MAEQKGFSAYSGTLGDKVGFRKGKKYFERKKTNSYQPPQESLKAATEFGLASKASALFRRAFAHLFLRSFLPDIHSRISKLFGEIIRSGPLSNKGKRQVHDGNIDLLKSYRFNPYKRFEDLSSITLTTRITDKFIVAELIPVSKPPKKILTTHRTTIEIGFTWFDFKHETYTLLNSNPIHIDNNESFVSKSLKIEVPQNGAYTFIAMACIYFESETTKKGTFIAAEDRRYQGGAILEALHFMDGELVQHTPNATEINLAKEPPPSNIFWE